MVFASRISPPKHYVKRFDWPSLRIDPCPKAPRIRHHLENQEDCSARLRWFPLRKLCEGQGYKGFPDWGAKDRQEGAQRQPSQEALERWTNLFVLLHLLRVSSIWSSITMAFAPWETSKGHADHFCGQARRNENINEHQSIWKTTCD